jgi:hypothetical protein
VFRYPPSANNYPRSSSTALHAFFPTPGKPEFVKYTPAETSMVPINKEIVTGSFNIKKARKTALTGTKLIKRLAREGPIFFMPS